MHRDDTSGVMAIEACIGLTFFMIVMFALFSMVTLFSAQSLIGHALSESCQSLALESYGTDKADGGWSITRIPADLVNLFTTDPQSNGKFTTDENISKADESTVQSLSRARFAAFLGGDEAGADAILKALGVQDGLGGMDFSKTSLDGADLNIRVTYKIELLIRADIFGLGEFTTTQSVCSRLWSGG